MSAATPTLVGERVLLCIPPPSRAKDCVRYHVDNAAHLAPWDPPRPQGFLTESFWRKRLAANAKEARDGASLRLHAFLRDDPKGPVLGEANLTQIFRGPFQNAYLGYSLAEKHQGRGLMTEALRLVVAHAFGPMRLHRIQANHLPDNARSARVLERLGFRREGLAKDYLFIAGAWRDHVLTAITNPDHPGP